MPQDIDWHKMRANASQTYSKVLVALGGNLPSAIGSPEKTLKAAIDHLSDSFLRLEAVSPFYATPCFPVGAGPDYVNAVALFSSNKEPSQILGLLHGIEALFGRERVQRWGRRTLDLDLLAVGQSISPDRATFDTWRDKSQTLQMTEAPDQLVLPHPRLHERAFVLVPLSDVAPDWSHPVLGLTVRDMLAQLNPSEVSDVRPISNVPQQS